jgi:hypothetical protein
MMRRDVMKKFFAMALIVLMLVALGCGRPMTYKEKSTLTGAAVGAGTGAGISALSGGDAGVGAALGGILGGVAGAIHGEQHDRDRTPGY